MPKKTNPGGSSHDRAVQKTGKRLDARLDDYSVVAAAHSQRVSTPERILRFVDSSWIQTISGLIGGLVGTFLDGRYFALISPLVSVALYKSKTLEGAKRGVVLGIHGVAIGVASICLYYMGISLNKSRSHTYTPYDYANAVRNNLPLPITRQITNVYKSYVTPTKSIGEPRIDLSEFIPDGVDAQGMNFHTNAINNGTVPALDVGTSVQSSVRIKSKASEDELFDFLEKTKADHDQPRSDQPPGEKYSHAEPITVTLSEQNKLDIQMGLKVLYLGHIDTYQDAQGHRYQSELCMYYGSPANTLMYCDGHNKSRRLSNPIKTP